ncbi:hypothetical protein GCM10010256_81040 [Streptomyces coeruleorubidus]|nr:hypothetical protein GCM10010256_81040 [Streptomyces coeruleorubidus]
MKVVVTGGKASGPAGPRVHPARPAVGSAPAHAGRAALRHGLERPAARCQSRANPSLAHNPVTRSSSATAAAPAVTVS